MEPGASVSARHGHGLAPVGRASRHITLPAELRAQVHDLGARRFQLKPGCVGRHAHHRLAAMQQGAHRSQQLQVPRPREPQGDPVAESDFHCAGDQGEASRFQRLTSLNAPGRARHLGAQGPGDTSEAGGWRIRWMPDPEEYPGERQQQNGDAGKCPPGPAPAPVLPPCGRSFAFRAAPPRVLYRDEGACWLTLDLARHGGADLLFQDAGVEECAEVVRVRLQPGRQLGAVRLVEGVIQTGGDPLTGTGHVARLSACNCCSTQVRSCSLMRCSATRMAAILRPRRPAISSESDSSK